MNTMDGSQGMERDILIVSLARNRPFRVASQNSLFNDKRITIVFPSRGRERIVLMGSMKDIRSISSNWSTPFNIVGAQKSRNRSHQGRSCPTTASDCLQYDRSLYFFKNLVICAERQRCRFLKGIVYELYDFISRIARYVTCRKQICRNY